MKIYKNRPYVVCHILSAIDGKIGGDFFRMPELIPVREELSRIRREYACEAVLNGAVTVAEIYADGYWEKTERTGKSYTREDFVADAGLKNPKMIVKICVDIGMTVALLFLMTYELIGQAFHEWLGIGIFVLFVVHHILNRKWFGMLLKGKYTPGNMMIGMIGKTGKIGKRASVARTWTARGLALVIAVYGIYAFIRRNIGS